MGFGFHRLMLLRSLILVSTRVIARSLTIYSIVLLWFYATCKTLQCNPMPCQRTKRIYKNTHTMQILFANLRSNSFMRLSRFYPTYVPIDGFYAPLYKNPTAFLSGKVVGFLSSILFEPDN